MNLPLGARSRQEKAMYYDDLLYRFIMPSDANQLKTIETHDAETPVRVRANQQLSICCPFDTELLNTCADMRIVDGIGGIDIDEWTADRMEGDSDEEWNLRWREGFRHAVASAAGIGASVRHGFYVASKCKHAGMWRIMRASGAPIISTWIDEAGEGESGDYAELAVRCLGEIARCSAVVLYAEPGDVLKGALLEVGAALAQGVPVYCVGDCESISRVFRKHPLWHDCRTFADVDAGLEAYRSPTA